MPTRYTNTEILKSVFTVYKTNIKTVKINFYNLFLTGVSNKVIKKVFSGLIAYLLRNTIFPIIQGESTLFTSRNVSFLTQKHKVFHLNEKLVQRIKFPYEHPQVIVYILLMCK